MQLMDFVGGCGVRKMRQDLTDNGLPNPANSSRMGAPIIIVFFIMVCFTRLSSAAGFNCPKGGAVLADLGDGVIMRTCMWEKAADVFVRTGPLVLIKNGVLILKLETDLNGKLHGEYTSWNDAGEITENGTYVEGLKEGPWKVTDKNGDSETLHYQAGVIVEP